MLVRYIGPNLIGPAMGNNYNPSFDFGGTTIAGLWLPKGWDNFNSDAGEVLEETVEVFDGVSSVHLVNNAINEGIRTPVIMGGAFGGTFVMENGKDYIVHVWAKPVAGVLRLQISSFSHGTPADGAASFDPVDYELGRWHRIGWQFTNNLATDDDYRFHIYALNAGGCEWYIDSVQIREIQTW